MDKQITTDVSAAGFHWSSGWDRDTTIEVAHCLGAPVGERRNPLLVRTIRPQKSKNAPPNTLSSRYGLGPFPFHTESAYWRRPPRFLVLYCDSPGFGRRPTLLVDVAGWELSEKHVQKLRAGVWKTGGTRPFLCSLIQHHEEGLRIRFDVECMKPMNRSAVDGSSLMNSRIRSSHPISIRWKRGDLLIVDNHRMLHARGAAAELDHDRILVRVLVQEPST